MDHNKVTFLIIRFSSIGDIVLTTPVIRGLKKQVPNAKIHYLTKKKFEPLLSANPYIDKLHLLEDDLNIICNAIKKEKIDYIIDLHKNLRSYRVKSKLKRIALSFDKLNIQKWLLVNFKINKLPNKHIVDRYLETVSVFSIENDQAGLDYFIPPADEVQVDAFTKEFQNGYIAFCIGGTNPTKQLTTHKIINVCNQLNYPVILLGDINDREKAGQIVKNTGNNVVNACGKYNINQSASIVKNAKVVITNDTGLMHIAAAFKKKIISIWGNTVPEFGMYPYLPDKNSQIIEIKGLPCRPCTKLGFQKCPKKHFKCIEHINETQIINHVRSLFEPKEEYI